MLEERAAKVKLLILDVDGVMTDGSIIINDHGEELKRFNVKDGLGIRLLMESGIDVLIISGRKSKTVEHRARDLGIREIYQGVKHKESLCVELIGRKGLKKDQVCCMGDDLPDIPMFKQAGISVSVADAAVEVRDAAVFVTNSKGGNGAVRELSEFILKSQGKWQEILSRFKEQGK